MRIEKTLSFVASDDGPLELRNQDGLILNWDEVNSYIECRVYRKEPFTSEDVWDMMYERGWGAAYAIRFLRRAHRRGSGTINGNMHFPINYTTVQMRKFVADQVRFTRNAVREYGGWDRRYYKGMVSGMSEMVDAIVNNDVEV